MNGQPPPDFTDSGLTRVTPAEAGLPACYGAVDVYTCDRPLSAEVEVARTLAELEERHGARPTTVFTRIEDRPGTRVLGHPYPRAVLLAALGAQEGAHLTEMSARLAGAPHRVRTTTGGGTSADGTPPGLEQLKGFDDLPVLQHRPGDGGRYVTAGIGVTTRPDGSGVNLGFYCVQVVSPRRARIFLDPRTDAHRNLREWTAAGRPMPLSVFLGANPVHAVVAASRLPAEGDDYQIASRLLREDVTVHGAPPVPGDATHVLTGLVRDERETEGPFGEFKGYYVEQREGFVLDLTGVAARPDAPWPSIVAGAESGLTLMSFQNEYLMYAHLSGQGLPVRSVRYSVEARGEFVVSIETDAPDLELVREAMRFDVRCKLVLCGPDLGHVGQALATHGFVSHREPYYRKGRIEGERLGLALVIPPSGRPVEY
ncbi:MULTISPECIES: UbiD family decarboxylase [unclassified Streptomyces]|uniref:UbiD family decarboxylase n=1 Tax=unclassified Streptomyces TaxID=2593676 RepID=UPI0005A6E1B1|nr:MULTISPECIES: UbiD family decarboxylase [unclassified Streptomyces]ODA72682.1 Phenolic acid decarboxylase subunit C [Streptomyces sp. AVP053U2]